jgi:hypothetical protein
LSRGLEGREKRGDKRGCSRVETRRKVCLRDTLIEGCISSCVQNAFSECPGFAKRPAEFTTVNFHLHTFEWLADIVIVRDVPPDLKRPPRRESETYKSAFTD